MSGKTASPGEQLDALRDQQKRKYAPGQIFDNLKPGETVVPPMSTWERVDQLVDAEFQAMSDTTHMMTKQCVYDLLSKLNGHHGNINNLARVLVAIEEIDLK